MSSVNQQIYDYGVRHQVGLIKLSTQKVREIVGLLNKTDADLLAQIAKYDPTETGSKRDLNKLLSALREVNEEAYSALREEVPGILNEVGQYEVEYQADKLDKVLPIKWDIEKPTAEQLEALVDDRPFLGKHVNEWIDGLEQGRMNRMRDAVRIGFTEGEDLGQLVARIRGTKANDYNDGVLAMSRRSAEGFVRTATNAVANTARDALWQKNDDLISGWRFVATLDNRTTITCASLDGEVFDVGDGPIPPRHPNCRSTTTPVLKSWDELGIDGEEASEATRASMDGQVPEAETYSTWLGRQSAATQDEVLGATRGRLFRDGSLDLSEMVNNFGKPLTLDELRRRDSSMFEE